MREKAGDGCVLGGGGEGAASSEVQNLNPLAKLLPLHLNEV